MPFFVFKISPQNELEYLGEEESTGPPGRRSETCVPPIRRGMAPPSAWSLPKPWGKVKSSWQPLSRMDESSVTTEATG